MPFHRYISTANGWFMQKAIVLASLVVCGGFTLYAMGQPLAAAILDGLGLIAMAVLLWMSRVTFILVEDGFAIKVRRAMTFYPWTCVRNMRIVPYGFVFEVSMFDEPAIFPVFDKKEVDYDKLKQKLIAICEEHRIPVYTN